MPYVPLYLYKPVKSSYSRLPCLHTNTDLINKYERLACTNLKRISLVAGYDSICLSFRYYVDYYSELQIKPKLSLQDIVDHGSNEYVLPYVENSKSKRFPNPVILEVGLHVRHNDVRVLSDTYYLLKLSHGLVANTDDNKAVMSEINRRLASLTSANKFGYYKYRADLFDWKREYEEAIPYLRIHAGISRPKSRKSKVIARLDGKVRVEDVKLDFDWVTVCDLGMEFM